MNCISLLLCLLFSFPYLTTAMESVPHDNCPEEENMLFAYTLKGEHESIKKFLKDHPNYEECKLLLSFRLAIDYDDAEAVTIFCTNSPNIHALPPVPDSSVRPTNLLAYAFFMGKLKAAQALLVAEPELILCFEKGKNRNALYYACQDSKNPKKAYSLVAEMLENGAKDLVNLKVEDAPGFWSYPLDQAVRLAEGGPLVKLLIKNGADVEILNIYGETPLYVAIRCRNYETAKALIDGGANPFALKPSPLYPHEEREDLELLQWARVYLLYKKYKDLYMLYKTPELVDSQVDGLRDFFQVEIWQTLYDLWLHHIPLDSP